MGAEAKQKSVDFLGLSQKDIDWSAGRPRLPCRRKTAKSLYRALALTASEARESAPIGYFSTLFFKNEKVLIRKIFGGELKVKPFEIL